MSNSLMSHHNELELAFGAAPAAAAEGRMVQLTSLLKQLDEHQSRPEPPAVGLDRPAENQLVQVRLGIASSLYWSLRWKHEPTAQHCLRVTLGCSHWAMRLGLPDALRDELELAALLHDIGKVGVPDALLTKPGVLTPPETAVMGGHWLIGQEILRTSCAAPGVLATVAAAPAWYDGSNGRSDLVGEGLPLAGRMLSIVDAFDAMMSDHVYRRALPRERAFNELYRFAGTQFDPRLVKLFAEFHECDPFKLQELVGQRWLAELDGQRVRAAWKLNEAPLSERGIGPEQLFQQKLVANMYDAVVFVDTNLKVIQWNHGAERLTGITGASIEHRRWLPSVLDMRDEKGTRIGDEDCPVAHSIRTGVQWLRRLTIKGRGDRLVAVDAHAVPVMAHDNVTHGLALLLHDVSPEISLEARCEDLHERATKDPLTQVANRAEFDRSHETFVAAHLEKNLPYSLIICDIDRFKRVNDTYGHQAGDEVIQSFARLLKTSCRSGDLAARYGGEEFVVLCADCDNVTAVRRADELRKAFSELPISALAGESVTASFGVTEIQPGDTPETMLRRADRALMKAKESGRNRVVQLGIGSDRAGGASVNTGDSAAVESGAGRAAARGDHTLLERCLISEAPLSVCIEKLRGFVADQHAEITHVDGARIRLMVADEGGSLLRRMADRPVRLLIDLSFEEQRQSAARSATGAQGALRTRIHIRFRPLRNRERRLEQAMEHSRQLLISFRAYLMATEIELPADLIAPTKSKGLFGGWFHKDR